jgi:hypothetical protein
MASKSNYVDESKMEECDAANAAALDRLINGMQDHPLQWMCWLRGYFGTPVLHV